jgi:hypothetical protein
VSVSVGRAESSLSSGIEDFVGKFLDISLSKFDSIEALDCVGTIFAYILEGRGLIFAGAMDLFLVRIEGSIVGRNPPLDLARLWVKGFREILFLNIGEGTDFDIDIEFDREGRENFWP